MTIADTTSRPRGLSALANPAKFLSFVSLVLPILVLVTIALFVAGLLMGFSVPDDYQQGRTVRIMFIHVPAVWMAMG
ncbi:MAG: heme transporter HemC, partial [Rhizobiaceae bacterium]